MELCMTNFDQFKHRYLHFLLLELNLPHQEANDVLKTTLQLLQESLPEQELEKAGQLKFSAISATEPAHKPRKYCKFTDVVLTLFADDDMYYRQEQGKNGTVKLRQRQMIRMANEAATQGALLSAEDFAYRIFNCGLRTISRDLRDLAAQNIQIPLRASAQNQKRFG